MKSQKISIEVSGIRPIMFDRFASMKTDLSPIDKCYSTEEGDLFLPAKNIMSFLTAVNTESATQRVMGKKWKPIAKAAMSFADIQPFEIPIFYGDRRATRDDLKIVEDKAIIKKGALSIPSEKSRPVLDKPWSMKFEIELFENNDLNEAMLKKIFIEGGLMIGFGTYRGLYGKFVVEKWTVS